MVGGGAHGQAECHFLTRPNFKMQEQGRKSQCITTSHYFILISELCVDASVVGKHGAPPGLIREYEGILLGHGLIALNPED